MTAENDTAEKRSAENARPKKDTRRRGKLWAGLVGFAVVALALGAARRHGEVELELVLAGNDFVQGAPVMLSFAVKNAADHEIIVDAWERFAADDPERCKSFEGIPVELVLYYESYPDPVLRTPYEPGDFGAKALVSGEKLAFQCDIAFMFGIVKPGRYQLKARYLREPWAHRPTLALPAKLWSSVVAHKEVTFTVRSRIYDDKNTESKIRGNLR